MWLELFAGIVITAIFSIWIWVLKRKIAALEVYVPETSQHEEAEEEEKIVRKPGIHTFDIE